MQAALKRIPTSGPEEATIAPSRQRMGLHSQRMTEHSLCKGIGIQFNNQSEGRTAPVRAKKRTTGSGKTLYQVRGQRVPWPALHCGKAVEGSQRSMVPQEACPNTQPGQINPCDGLRRRRGLAKLRIRYPPAPSRCDASISRTLMN